MTNSLICSVYFLQWTGIGVNGVHGQHAAKHAVAPMVCERGRESATIHQLDVADSHALVMKHRTNSVTRMNVQVRKEEAPVVLKDIYNKIVVP